ncbi:MAG: 5'-nucleotidase C-terminal domain-containing protein [Paludibacteraceae bacterium]|jgi:2',3'-cyclic-nucleotide 2'-phosphodiesterase (5'-nucleotidase family)|nr:5'-nucleotidase C-terminal domain-containing protein [Paludibacteraceae bacterium]MDI9536292.1 5'-nucleotidase C-terminal domain-containing protein [Bacteroidota bacterium]HHT61519.1 hypothetical protein [Bacteroidales bacterium]MBP9038844.1 5'-nucleotidase C-terminal domain-containing protein [Paludibacteraceae bacterium]HOG35789.1 5'-nucleotidase C-terminal domain-containing protein [Paludibacteraceae bacterium]
MYLRTLILVGVVGVMYSCCAPNPKIVSAEFVPVTPRTSGDSAFRNQLNVYYQEIADKMNVEIGTSAQQMETDRPEGLLNNFVAETMLKYGNAIKPTDVAISNIGGLRRDLPEGKITVGTIYELMPFYNKLVFLKFSADQMDDICQAIAKKGGDVVAGISMMITKDNKAVNIKIGGQPLKQGKIYRVITTDYLSEGMDGLEPLANYMDEMEPLDVVMCDMMIEEIKKMTEKNQVIKTTLKNNIYVEK